MENNSASQKKNFVKGFEDLIPPTNNTRFKRVLAIGDIHGNFSRFASLWKKIHVTDDDFVFFLGDYVDRGERIEETVRWILSKAEEKNIVFLRGNHEQMFIDFFSIGDNLEEYRQVLLVNGGYETLNALRNCPDVIQSFLQFAKAMSTYCPIKIGGREYFLCHAGVDPNYLWITNLTTICLE